MGAQKVWELSGGWKMKEARKTKARNSGVRKLEGQESGVRGQKSWGHGMKL